MPYSKWQAVVGWLLGLTCASSVAAKGVIAEVLSEATAGFAAAVVKDSGALDCDSSATFSATRQKVYSLEGIRPVAVADTFCLAPVADSGDSGAERPSLQAAPWL